MTQTSTKIFVIILLFLFISRAYSQAPSISNLSVSTGYAGNTFNITGSNFQNVYRVTFTNNVNAVFSINTPTSITATIPFGAITGPVTVTNASGSAISSTNIAIAPSYYWVKNFGIGTSNGEGSVIDTNKNIFALTSTRTSSTVIGLSLIKYDSTGQPLWSRQTTSNAQNLSSRAEKACLAIDPAGNIYIAGHFYNTTTFSGTATTLTSSGDMDMFLAKYDNDGNFMWARKAGGTAVDQAMALATDAANNVYVTGSFQSIANFSGTNVVGTSGSQDVFVAKYDVNGNLTWLKTAGGDNPDIGNSISVENDGTCYITGTYKGSFTSGSNTINAATGADVNIFVLKITSGGNFSWLRSAGSSSTDYPSDIFVDKQGNFYLTGYMGAAATLQPHTTTFSGGVWDFFFAKYDTTGSNVWVKTIGASNARVEGLQIDKDPSGNLYLVGLYDRAITVGSTLLSNSLQTNFIFAAKYDANGNNLWAKTVTIASGIEDSEYAAVTVRGTDNLIITGSYGPNATFDNQAMNNGSSNIANGFITNLTYGNPVFNITAINPLSAKTGEVVTLYGNAYSDIKNITFASTYSKIVTTNFRILDNQTIEVVVPFGMSSGYIKIQKNNGDSTVSSAFFNLIIDPIYDFVMAKKAGGTDYDVANSIVTDAAGNTYTTGAFRYTSFWGSNYVISNGGTDVFVSKQDNNGNSIWVVSSGGTNNDEGKYIAVDKDGNLYVAGIFSNTATFGSYTFTAASGSYNTDLVLLKYDASGNLLWAKQIGNGNAEKVSGITTDANGLLYISGTFNASLTFGVTVITSYGNDDIFIAKYDASGNALWARKGGSSGSDLGCGISSDQQGNIYLVGRIESGAIFGSANLPAGTGTNATLGDVVVVKYDSNGNVFWGKRFQNNYYDYATTIAADHVGNVFIGGVTDYSTYKLTFMKKLDTQGNVINSWQAIGLIEINKIDFDYFNEPYAVGSMTGYAVQLGNGDTFPQSGCSAAQAAVLIKFDTGCRVYFGKKLSGASMGNSIALDSLGNVFIAGAFAIGGCGSPGGGSVDFGSITLTSNGSGDIYVAKIGIVAPEPYIYSFDPSKGSEGTTVTITGVKFIGTTSVTFNGANATFTVVNDNTIIAHAPTGVTAGYIGVITASGSALSGSKFYICDPVSQPIASDVSRCGSGSLSITASGASASGTYQWYDSVNPSVIISSSNPFVTPIISSSRSYSVAVNLDGCISSMTTVNAVVLNIPMFINQPINVSKCESTDPVIFSVTASGSAITYQWQENTGSFFYNLTEGGIYNGVTNASLNLSNVTAAMNGYTYRCVITGSCGTINSDAVGLDISTIPSACSLSNPSNNAANIPLDSPTFTWQAEGGVDTYTIEISDDASFSSTVFSQTGITASSLTPNIRLNAGTQYYWHVKAENACGTGNFSSVNSFQSIVTFSLNNESQNGKCVLFPNPTNQYILVNLPDGNFTNADMRITDSHGKDVYMNCMEKTNSTDVLRIDLGMCSPGIYLFVFNSNELHYNQKIILTK